MRAKVLYPYLLSILSGVLFVISLETLYHVLGCLALVPLLYSLSKTEKIGQAFLLSFLAGAVGGGYISFWFIEGIDIFTGGESMLGYLGYSIAIGIVAIYFSVFGLLFFFCKKYFNNSIQAGVIWAVLAGLWDMLYASLFHVFPVLVPHLSYTQVTNIALLQHAEWGGMHIISFLVFIINFFIFYYLDKRNARSMWLLIAVISIINISGYAILKIFESRSFSSEKNLRIACVNPQFSSQDQWNEKSGNALMNKLMTGCSKAYEYNPDLIIWTEGVVPWHYEENDDFIQAIRSMNAGRSTQHIIGMSSIDEGQQYNSAYAFDFKNNTIRRYDKHYLLPFAERQADFNSSSNLLARATDYTAGDKWETLTEINGAKISTIICHENLYAGFVKKMVSKTDPDLIIVIANNAWAAKSRIATKGHFYVSAFRAIENRVPILMNSNKGMTGYVHPSGRVEWIEKGYLDLKLYSK